MYRKVKKISFLLLSMIALISSAYAQRPWAALCGDRRTPSLFEMPQGDFSRKKVAVVDNGFDVSHCLLEPRLDEQGCNGRDYASQNYGFFRIANRTSSAAQKRGHVSQASIVEKLGHHDYGKTASHGTHVAGIIAQMTPYIKIVPCKRGAPGHRTKASDRACLDYLTKRDDVAIVNMSFGTDWKNLKKPIQTLASQGKLVVISAGNDGKILNDKKVAEFLNNPKLQGRVVLIGATRKSDGLERLASFSNRPSELYKNNFIAVPGKDILSSVPVDTVYSGRKELSGTSMAAPVFAGAVARLMTEFNASIDEVLTILFETAVKESNDQFNISQTGQGIMNFIAAREEFKRRAKQKAEKKVLDEKSHRLPENKIDELQTIADTVIGQLMAFEPNSQILLAQGDAAIKKFFPLKDSQRKVLQKKRRLFRIKQLQGLSNPLSLQIAAYKR